MSKSKLEEFKCDGKGCSEETIVPHGSTVPGWSWAKFGALTESSDSDDKARHLCPDCTEKHQKLFEEEE